MIPHLTNYLYCRFFILKCYLALLRYELGSEEILF